MSANDNSEGKGPGTHVATTPNKKPLTQIDTFRAELASAHQKQIVNFFNGDNERAMKFLSAANYSVQKTPALLGVDRSSLITALMTCAQYNLYPSNAGGEAFIIPYKGKAQFQLGYQGLITLLYRAGVESINAQIIFEKDKFEYEEGLETRLVHKPNIFEDRGKPIAVYAVASVNGQKIFKIMSEADVMKIKDMSQAKGSEYSPWNSNDPELWMWKKTAIRQLAKVLPKNEDLNKAIEIDNEDSIISARANALDAAGPAVARAAHAPESLTPPAEGAKE